MKQLQRRGVRERLEVKELASGEPYDFGRLEIVEEPWTDTEPFHDEASAPTEKPARRLPLAAG